MVEVGYDPVDNAVLYNASTGEQCEGCCSAAECSDCPTPAETPLNIEVTIADMVNCECFEFARLQFTCQDGGTIYGSTAYDVASEFNGVHTLVQNTSCGGFGIGSCSWGKTIPVEFDIKVNQDEPPPDPGEECDSAACATWNIDTLCIEVAKVGSQVGIRLIGIDAGHAAIAVFQFIVVSGCEITGTDCFDCTGFPADFYECDIDGVINQQLIVGGGTIDVTG